MRRKARCTVLLLAFARSSGFILPATAARTRVSNVSPAVSTITETTIPSKEVEEKLMQPNKGEESLTYTYSLSGPTVTWSASSKGKRKVVQREGNRDLNSYLALPPTEYSLLDPTYVTRISDNEFRCSPGMINWFSTMIEPIMYVRVDSGEAGRVVMEVYRMELDGSPLVRSASSSFTFECNMGVWVERPWRPKQPLQLGSSINVKFVVKIPEENWIPQRVLKTGGSFVLQRCMDLFLPQFLKFLEKDYTQWSAGDDSRAAVAEEGMSLMGADTLALGGNKKRKDV